MALAACMLSACSSENAEEDVFNGSSAENDTEVTLTFSPYRVEEMTRTIAPISDYCNHLDVWIVEGDNVVDIHQESTDADFGVLSVSLNKTKTYTLYAVGHKANGAATLSNGVIAFPEEKVTHTFFYSTTFSPSTTTTLSCVMQRIVGMFRFEVADVIPDEAYTMTFSLGHTYTRWNVAGYGLNFAERTVTFENFSRNSDGTAAFSMYFIPANLTDQELHDITVTATASDGSLVESKTFEAVPIRANYKTTYHGQFFTTTAMSISFQADDWSSFDAVIF